MKLRVLILLGLLTLTLLAGVPSFLSEERGIEQYKSSPNGIFVTHLLAWDLGVIDQLTGGYVQYYDAEGASLGEIQGFIGSPELTSDLIEIPNLQNGKKINQFFQPSLLKSFAGIIEEHGDGLQFFEGNRFDDKLNMQAEFDSHFPKDERYLTYVEQDCSMEGYRQDELAGKIYQLRNFDISILESSSEKEVFLLLTCKDFKAEVKLDLSKAEFDPNNILPALMKFLAAHEDQLDDALYVVEHSGDVIALDQEITFSGRLLAAYLMPINFNYEKAEEPKEEETESPDQPEVVSPPSSAELFRKDLLEMQAMFSNRKNLKKKALMQLSRKVKKQAKTFERAIFKQAKLLHKSNKKVFKQKKVNAKALRKAKRLLKKLLPAL